MYRIRRCRCTCCGLDQDIVGDAQSAVATPVCARCVPHEQDPRARNTDHATMYLAALDGALDELSLARGQRDFYRERGRTMDRSSETLVRVLTEIDHLHHARGSRCSCGEPACRVQDLVADPAVARLIGTYDEEQFTLREVRRENPGTNHEEWDYIDVTLVYPPDYQHPVGRHRAVG
jgi:hypothetical protein